MQELAPWHLRVSPPVGFLPDFPRATLGCANSRGLNGYAEISPDRLLDRHNVAGGDMRYRRTRSGLAASCAAGAARIGSKAGPEHT